MDEVGSTDKNGAGQSAAPSAGGHAAVNAISFLSFHSWSDHALGTINSAAALVGLLAGIILLISLAVLYLSGREIMGRTPANPSGTSKENLPAVTRTDQSNGGPAVESKSEVRRLTRLTKELAEARSAVELKRAELAKATSELTRTQKSEKSKTEEVARLERDAATIRRSEEEKSLRLAELEDQLNRLRRADGEKATQLTQLQKDLEVSRKSAETKATPSPSPPAPEGGRLLSLAQRETFLKVTKGLPTGKVIVSAFFENRETHEFGRRIISLLRDAGFPAAEQAPVNFFTTSRPSSGIRIGCEDMTHRPAHFSTLRKGFEAMGIEITDSTVVNADSNDVVEIQITPRE